MTSMKAVQDGKTMMDESMLFYNGTVITMEEPFYVWRC